MGLPPPLEAIRPKRPTGAVTFLFTDIEGSTQLWEQFPEAMRLALAHHDTLLRQAIEAHGGYVFKTVWAKGRVMTLEEAVQYALETEDPKGFQNL